MSARRWYAHITLALGNIPDGLITLAKLATTTANRLLVTNSSGTIGVHSALTASRLLSSDANGLPQVNASLTSNRLAYADGTGSLASNASLTQNRVVIGDANGLPTPASAITASRALISDSNGVPTHSTVTSTELATISGGGTNAFDFLWQFSSSTTMADPGSGFFRLDNATPSSVANIAISDTDYGGTDRDTMLDSINGALFQLHKKNTSVTHYRFRVSGAATDNGTWHQLPVTFVANNGVFTNNDVIDFRKFFSLRFNEFGALGTSRVMVTDSSGFGAANAALTDNRVIYQSAAGVLSSNTALTQNRVVIGDANGLPTPASAITASRALVSDSNGVPTHATLTSANLENVAHTVSDTTTVDLTLSSGTLSADVNRTATGLGWVYISTSTASSSASITFTGLTTYSAYKVVIFDVQPATDNVQMLWRASTDGGSSYASSASYNWAAAAVGTAGTFVGAGAASDTSVRLAGAMGNADNTEAGSFVFELIHRGSGSSVSRVISYGTYRSATPDTLFFNVGGTYNVGDDVDAIQFLMSSGNITRGTFRLYGLKES